VIQYPYEEGQILGQVALDAIAMLFEYDDHPELLAASVTVVARDDDGEITTCCQTWAADDA
jgi:hypothetical protein